MGRNAIETILGAVVLIVAALFMLFAYSSADLHRVKGYSISANFPMVDGLKVGGDVRINGVKVGSIDDMRLNTDPGPHQFLVNVTLSILPNIRLPVDTIALVATESLLGGKYLSLEVGVDDELIKNDGSGKITRTQPPMRLDDLIGQLIYSSKKSENSNSGAGGSSASGASGGSGASGSNGAAAVPAHP